MRFVGSNHQGHQPGQPAFHVPHRDWSVVGDMEDASETLDALLGILHVPWVCQGSAGRMGILTWENHWKTMGKTVGTNHKTRHLQNIEELTFHLVSPTTEGFKWQVVIQPPKKTLKGKPASLTWSRYTISHFPVDDGPRVSNTHRFPKI